MGKMGIKTLFWNIENYSGDPARTAEAVAHIKKNDPDVIGFCEIKDKAALRSLLQDNLSDYDFGVTDGREGIELLAGWRRGKFEQALYTQRREFKAGNDSLRPGSLLSVKSAGEFFNFLFLHTDSGTKGTDYANRQAMFEKIWSLKETLDDITTDGPTNLVVMGDLNTMGRTQSGAFPKVSGQTEIDELARDAQAAGMLMLGKNQDRTWARVNQSGPDIGKLRMHSNLDHVLATDNLAFVAQSGGKEVEVRGWVDATTNDERFDFVQGISDHCSIECEIA
jgi:exonuclease III